MKLSKVVGRDKSAQSLPAWGVWIEIGERHDIGHDYAESLPAWGVWIEITPGSGSEAAGAVAPRMGSVD